MTLVLFLRRYTLKRNIIRADKNPAESTTAGQEEDVTAGIAADEAATGVLEGERAREQDLEKGLTPENTSEYDGEATVETTDKEKKGTQELTSQNS